MLLHVTLVHAQKMAENSISQDQLIDDNEQLNNIQQDVVLEKNTESPVVSDSSQIIGIDLGTTYSCVAIWENDRANVIANNMGNRTTPSWVCFHQGSIFAGEAARNKGLRFPKNTIYDAKRMIGRKLDDPSIYLSLKNWPFDVTEHKNNCAVVVSDGEGAKRVLLPEEISAYILVRMKQTAEDYLGVPVKRAVVTVPAYFNDAQRQATIDTATIAGLTVERIINEPTAAALAYGMERGMGDSGARTLLVYDLGGGTLDVTVMTVDRGVFEVLSTCGDTQLGGQDFDSNLVDYFVKEIKEKMGTDITGNSRAIRKLRDHCQLLKHNLSHSESAVIEVDSLVDGEDFESSLTRAQFAEINQDLFDRCSQPLNRAILDAGITKDSIDEVVLIGGSTRIVRLQHFLEGFFPGVNISKRINPDEAVAMGAAIQGANLGLSIEEKTEKLKGVTLMDVTPLSLGIELAGGKMSVIIPRNTTIPYSHTRTYKNNEDNQTKATIEVYEGEDKLTQNNRLLGKFTINGLPPRPRGKVEVDVKFSLNANGVLEVTGSVKGIGEASASIKIEKEKGLLTKEEIEERKKKVAEWERICKEQKLN